MSRICPRCNREYTEYPALSRRDNETEICPDCSLSEAIEDFTYSILKDKEGINEVPEGIQD